MRGKIMRVTLALGLLMTALHLAPQYARAEEAMANSEEAMRGHIHVMLEDGLALPEPIYEREHRETLESFDREREARAG